jgi:hypothetical protein
MVRITGSFLSLLFTAWLFFGCQYDPVNEDEPTSYATIPETTKPIDDSTAELLQSADENGKLIFAGSDETVDAIEVGDVVVIGITEQTPEGLLRKVTGRSSSGTTVTFSTEQAALEEAVESGHIEASAKLASATLDPAERLPGMSVRQHSKHFGPRGIAIDLDGVEITPDFSISGTIDFDIDLEINIDIEDFSLELFECLLTPNYRANLAFDSSVTAALETEKELGRIVFTPIAIPVGAITVVFTPQLSLNVGADGSISIGAGAQYEHSAELTTGFSYDGDWNKISEYNASFDFQAPEASAACSARVYLGPQFFIKIQGIVGPAFNLYGYLGLDAAIVDSIPHWSLTAGLTLDALVKLDIVKVISEEFDFGRLINYHKVLASGEGSESNNWENGIIATHDEEGHTPPNETDIVQGSDGKMHVFYGHGYSTDSLYHAIYSDGLWSSRLIDADTVDDIRPQAVAADGSIHLFYIDKPTEDEYEHPEYNSYEEAMRYGYFDGSDWHFERAGFANIMNVEYRPSALAITPSGEPHLFWIIHDAGDEILQHTWKDNGSWQTEEVFRVDSYLEYVTAVSGTDGILHVAAGADYDIFYCTKNNGNWVCIDPTQKIDDDDWGYRNLGKPAIVTLDPNGLPRIFYTRYTNPEELIFCAYPIGNDFTNPAHWTHELVIEVQHVVYNGIDAAIDSNGTYHFSYWTDIDSGDNDIIRYLRSDQNGNVLETIQPTDSDGFSAIIIDSEDNPWICYPTLSGTDTDKRHVTRVARWTGP